MSEPLACKPVSEFMDAALIKKKFDRLGARAKIRPFVGRVGRGPVVIDVGSDRRGEFFDIQANQDADLEVIDVRPKDRHLLLMVRQPGQRAGEPDIKDKFLCGHDERHWFVAGVPDNTAVSDVTTAKESLKPDLVRRLESGKKGKRRKRQRPQDRCLRSSGRVVLYPITRDRTRHEASVAQRADQSWVWP